jgi:DNA polymerase
MPGFFDHDQYIRKTVNCNECPLNYRRKVWGEGKLDESNSGIVFLGEAPGKDEDEEGRPFVGRAGKLLNKALHELNIRRAESWTTNVINCRPPDNDFSSYEAKVAKKKCCGNGIFEELDILKGYGYKAVMPLGNNPGEVFDLPTKITQIHGQVYHVYGMIVVPTYHPSYILRKGGVGSEVWYEWLKDFRVVLSEILLNTV